MTAKRYFPPLGNLQPTFSLWESDILMSELINNRETRQKILKDIVRDLHSGKSVEEVMDRFDDLIRDIEPEEISIMEQSLINEGISVEEIKHLCDVHTAIFRKSLNKQVQPENIPGHPIHTFKKENRAIEKLISKRILPLAEKISRNETSKNNYADLRVVLNKLMDIDKHFLRKEHLLFPFLEKYGISGPSSVMWGIHDDIRKSIKDAIELISDVDAQPDSAMVAKAVRDLCDGIESMIYKEEKILFPMALKLLTRDEWASITRQSLDIGFCLIEPDNLWSPEKRMRRLRNRKLLAPRHS